MTALRSSYLAGLVGSIIILALVFSFPGCGGSQPPAKPMYISITPRNAVAWSNSAESQVAYKVVVSYSDGRDVPLTTGITWLVDMPWVWFDSTTATATCEYPAPQIPFFGPQPANITATATVESQKFTDTVFIDCF